MDRLNSQSGFTLTELLISVIIIAIGVVGFASAVGIQSTELWIGRRDTQVSLSITRQAEVLKAMPYDSVQSGSLVDGEYTLNWVVQGANPKRVVLEATFQSSNQTGMLADTIVFYVPR